MVHDQFKKLETVLDKNTRHFYIFVSWRKSISTAKALT